MLRADLRQAMTCEVVALLERAAEADEAEPELDIPEELKRREERLAVIEAAQAEIERRARERFAAEQAAYEEKLAARREQERATGRKFGGRPPKAPEAGPGDKGQVNLTDGELRITPSPEGFAQCYNAQSAVDVESHLVVTVDVSDECNDKRQVAPALEGLDGLPAALGKPVGLLADRGISAGRTWSAARRMAHRLKTPEGRAVYARRKSTVETVFGIVKEAMGFRRFHLRGLEAVRGEWTLTCLAWNLKRMHALS